MSDDGIAGAVKRLAELEHTVVRCESKIKRAKSQIVEIKRFISTWEKFSGRSAPSISDIESNLDMVLRPLKRSDINEIQNAKKEVIAETVRGFILSRGTPISRAELYALLVDSGEKLKGGNPQMVLSTMLWRQQDKVIRLKSGGYWVPELPHKASGYDPGSMDGADTIEPSEATAD